MIKGTNSSQKMQHHCHVVFDDFAHILLRLLGKGFLGKSDCV
jgi:hypothetical protein